MLGRPLTCVVPPNSHRQAFRLLESRLSKRIFIVFPASGGSKRRLTPECSFFASAPREVEDHP